MNYIFLDIDGVLNSDNYFIKHIEEFTSVDETRVELLAKLVKKSNAKIVLTSSWRIIFNQNMEPRHYHEKAEELVLKLKKYGISLFDKTKVNYNEWGDAYDAGNRYEETKNYIDNNLDNNDRFVIFDDEDFNSTLLKFGNNFIKTDWFNFGLNEEHIKKAEAIFQEGGKS